MGWAGGRAAVPVLLAMLGDGGGLARAEAARSLGLFGAAGPEVDALLADDGGRTPES